MKLQVPFEILFLLRTLQQAGFEAYLVGGAVRDLIIHAATRDEKTDIASIDYDFTTNATPEEIQKIFPESFYENEYGTVGVTHENLWKMLESQHFQLPAENLATRFQARWQERQKSTIIDLSTASKLHDSFSTPDPDTATTPEPKPFEITTYRTDGTYDDHRRPQSVSWGKSIEEDLQRRDFTINAMALKIPHSVLENVFDQKVFPSLVSLNASQYTLVDPHRGMQDLAKKLVRAVGDPSVRFQEDALRMLRAIRFSTQLQIDIELMTFAAIEQHNGLIQHISWERIQDEFFKILASPLPKRGIELMDQTGLLAFILPELLEGKGVQQGGHHNTDVWTHALDALENSPSFDPIVRFATLLHDIGKPRTQNTENGKITFYNHEIIGSRMASKIAERFKLSRKDQDRLFLLVRYHMFYYQPENTDAALRRFMRKIGLENIDDILDLREADRLGSGARKTSWRLEEMKQRMIEQLNQPMNVKDLAINGDDLMQELNLKPGKQIGEILNTLFEQVMENPELNTRESLLDQAKKLL